MSWSSWQCLASVHLVNCPHLSLMSANTILAACPRVTNIGALATWGRVDREQLRVFRQEIQRRNFDITIE